MINLHIYETKMRAITGSNNNNSESNNNESRNNNGNLRQTTAAAATVNNNQACAWVGIAKGVGGVGEESVARGFRCSAVTGVITI